MALIVVHLAGGELQWLWGQGSCPADKEVKRVGYFDQPYLIRQKEKKLPKQGLGGPKEVIIEKIGGYILKIAVE